MQSHKPATPAYAFSQKGRGRPGIDQGGKVVFFSCLGIFAAWLPWYNFSATLTLIRQELKLSNTESGLILSAFQLGYVATVIFAGWLSDRIGSRAPLVVSCLTIGVSSAAFSLYADSYATALILRTIVGMGSGGIYVPGLVLISTWTSQRKRGKAFGAYTGASIASFAAAYLLGGPIATILGWRYSVLLTSLPPFMAAAVFYHSVAKPAALKTIRATSLNSLGDGSGAATFALLPAVLITIGYMAHMWEQFAFWGWVGPFFSSAAVKIGMSRNDAVFTSGMMASASVLVGIIASWLGGALSDRLGRVTTAGVISTLSALCSFTFGWLYGSSLYTLLSLGLVYGFLVAADSAIYKAAFSETLPGNLLGMGLALQSAFGFGASVISPSVVGMILDAIDPTSASNLAWGLAFSSLGLGIASPVSLHTMRRLRMNAERRSRLHSGFA